MLYHSKNLRINIENTNYTCDKCKFHVRNTKPNSTPRDILLTYSVNGIANINLFLRTLRHTGSKCTCVIFVDSKALRNINSKMMKDIKNCGGHIIELIWPPIINKKETFTVSYIIMIDFILRNIDQIDRVIKADLFDTVFQGDPFNELLPRDSIHVTEEGLNLYCKDCDMIGPINQGELSIIGYHVNSEVFYYVCAGYFGGDATIVKNFLSLALSHYYFGRDWMDQAIFNMLIDSGKLRDNNINYITNNSVIRHLSGQNIVPDGKELIGNVTIPYSSRYASVIHHYYKSSKLISSLLKYCPRDDENLHNYVDLKGLPYNYEFLEQQAQEI